MLHLGENGILDKNEGSTQIALVLSVRYLGVKVLQRDVRSLERKGVEGRGERTKRSYLCVVGMCVVCVCWVRSLCVVCMVCVVCVCAWYVYDVYVVCVVCV